jgi:hypothetical protein
VQSVRLCVAAPETLVIVRPQQLTGHGSVRVPHRRGRVRWRGQGLAGGPAVV